MKVQMVERMELEYTRSITADYDDDFKTGGFGINVEAKGLHYNLFCYLYRWSDCTIPPLDLTICTQQHIVKRISFYVCDHGMVQKTQFCHPLTLCEQEILFIGEDLIRDDNDYPVYQDMPGDFDLILDGDDFYVVKCDHYGELFGYPLGINGRDQNYILMDHSNDFQGVLMKSLGPQGLACCFSRRPHVKNSEIQDFDDWKNA